MLRHTRSISKIILTALLAACFILSAEAQTKHILERGETLESIAKKYGVTTQQIIELNPEVATFTYIGMELTIPETNVCTPSTSTATATSTGQNATVTQTAPTSKQIQAAAPQTAPAITTTTTSTTTTTTYYPSEQRSRDSYPEDKISGNEYNVFSMAALVSWQYNLSMDGGDFKLRSQYGIMAEGCTELSRNLGLGMAFGFRANYGLVPKDYGGLNGFFGPTIAVAFGDTKSAGIYLPVCVGLASDGDKTNWGCVVIPHFAFSLNRVRINAGCFVDTDFSDSSVSLMVGLGYEF